MADNIAQRIEAAERAARKATSYAWLVRWAAQGNGEVGAEQEPPANVSTPPGHHSAPPSDGSVPPGHHSAPPSDGSTPPGDATVVDPDGGAAEAVRRPRKITKGARNALGRHTPLLIRKTELPKEKGAGEHKRCQGRVTYAPHADAAAAHAVLVRLPPPLVTPLPAGPSSLHGAPEARGLCSASGRAENALPVLTLEHRGLSPGLYCGNVPGEAQTRG